MRLLALLVAAALLAAGLPSGPGETLAAEVEATRTYRDQFGTVAYTNSDGTTAWGSTPWTETDAGGGGPSLGNVRITGGELRLNTAGSAISRPVNLTTNITAKRAWFSFELRETAAGYGDELAVEVTQNGTNWTTLEIIHGADPVATGSRVYDITYYIASTAQIRFRINYGVNSAEGEYYYLDDVQVEYSDLASYSYGPSDYTTGVLGDYNSSAFTCDNPSVSYFLVYDDFQATDLNVALNITHDDRGDVRVWLVSPAGTKREIVSTSSDGDDNYDVIIDDDSAAALDDNSTDDVEELYYDRTAGPSANGSLDAYDGENSAGPWMLYVCDADTSSGDTRQGTVNHSRLIFTGTANPPPPPPSPSTGPAVVQTYFLPTPENHVITMMDTNFRSAGSTQCSSASSFQLYNKNPKQPVISVTSISIGDDGTVVFYDHFEDGYEVDIRTRTQASTQVWGDGDTGNGIPPGFTTDSLGAGDVILLSDKVRSDRLNSALGAPRYDWTARDKIGASMPIAMSRAQWAGGSVTLFAGALELYPVDEWGTSFRLPIGEDSDVNDMFDYVGATMMAAQDATTISLNGTPIAACTNLSQGQGCQINGGLNLGNTITSDKPIQVGLVTTNACAGFENRWFALRPTAQWDDSYFVPVGTTTSTSGSGNAYIFDDVPTYAHIYNPGTSAITVQWATQSGNQTSFTVNANSRVNRTIPVGEAARFWTATGAPFYVVATVDSDPGGTNPDRNDTCDYGFSAMPESRMSQDILVGLGIGNDPEYLGNSPQNYSPIHLTAYKPGTEATTSVCVDYYGDGGSLGPDPNTGRFYDQMLTVADLDSVLVYENPLNTDPTDLDQTAMQLWVCDGSDTAVITAVWGQDPFRSEPGSPSIDTGTLVPNRRGFSVSKADSLWVDVNGDGLYDEGDTVRWTIVVANTSFLEIPANGLTVTDVLASLTTYVPNSTRITYSDTGNTYAAADSGTTPFPLDEGGIANSHQPIPKFQTATIAFDVTLEEGSGEQVVCNAVTADDGTAERVAEACLYVQAPRYGAIGDYVWLDEDGDGDQDEGEAGIPNVKVTLTDGVSTWTTYTDAHGGYLFPNLPPGNYTLTVDTSTLPSGLAANPTYDEDNGTYNDAVPGVPNNQTAVTLGPGEEHMTADFGYNWASPQDTNSPCSAPCVPTGAIGDRVWVDTDGDGKQDADEIGTAEVTVQLWYDSDGDGVVDALWPVDTGYGIGVAQTDASGNYIFDGLPAGIYSIVVTDTGGKLTGYSQTGDPDHYGTSVGTNDGKTTTPIVLGPGDVFVDADFGYQPTTATSYSIGNTVFFDSNSNGTYDGSDYGIPSVTVSLIKDTNGNGVWDQGEPIIATDTTDANGQYLFDGLPGGASGDYLVWVNDTAHVLEADNLTQSSQPDGTAPYQDGGVPCTTCSSIYSVRDLATDVGYADFGYMPKDLFGDGTGMIGDTVFLDMNPNGGGYEAGTDLPLEGVMVKLYDADAELLAYTFTDENGHYSFGGLDPTATYQVQVVTSTLPSAGAGLTNTYDADGTEDSFTSINLANHSGVYLDADFGYRPSNPGSIGNLVWNDLNADGNVDDGESGIGGVTVDLYEDSNGNGILDGGDSLVGTTTTASDGSYLFSGLPAGDYFVDVSDRNGVLAGYWQSYGAPDTDNNSQVDPWLVNLSAGEHYVAADFGYYLKPAAVGNYVWFDQDGDGIQDDTESGLEGVVVTLTIDWPNGTSTAVTTVTDADGYYAFGNLLLDEDYNGDGTGSEPVHTISIDLNQAALSGYDPSPMGGGTPYSDSNDPAGTVASPVEGRTDTTNNLDDIASYDFGFVVHPTNVVILSFTARWQDDTVLVQWETVSEQDNLGFNLTRSDTQAGAKTQLNAQLIPTLVPPGSPFGAAYEWLDNTAQPGAGYFYWLEMVDTSYVSYLYEEPAVLPGGYWIYLPAISR